MQKNKYLPYFNLFSLFDTKRTRDIFQVNPTLPVERKEAENLVIEVFDYTSEILEHQSISDIKVCTPYKNNGHITWINIDGIRKTDVEAICSDYNIHYLIAEDILSVGQRPKMDEIDNILFCLLNMLYFNEKESAVETEQISLVLGKDFVLSFQEDDKRDVFNPLRERLKVDGTKIRQQKSDFLFYSLIDMIVDNYFVVMEK